MPSPIRTVILTLSFSLATYSFAQYAENVAVTSALVDAPAADLNSSSSRANLDALDAVSSASAGAVEPASAAYGGGAHAPVIVPAGNDPWFLNKFSFGATVSPLGFSVGSATSLSRSLNLRIQGNFFSYSFNETLSGVSFDANASFHSIMGQFDWFPFQRSTFHVSPGVLFYNQNQLSGNGVVTVGESITFNNANYYSDSEDPIRGTGKVIFRKTSPMVTVGWGNWVPRRREKHLTFPIDLGFAYVGDPAIRFNLQGSACNGPNNFECGNVNTDPSFQSNLNAQIVKYRQDLNVIRFYPIVSTGIVYKF